MISGLSQLAPYELGLNTKEKSLSAFPDVSALAEAGR